MNNEVVQVSNDYSLVNQYHQTLMDKQVERAKTFLDKFRSNTNEKSNGDKLDATEIIDINNQDAAEIIGINNLDVSMGNIFVKYLNFFTNFIDISGYSHLFYLGTSALLGLLIVNLFYTKKTVNSDNENLNITNVNSMQETQYDSSSTGADAQGDTDDDDLLTNQDSISLSDADAEGDTDEDIIMDQDEISPLDSAVKPENYKNLSGFKAVMSNVLKSSAD